MAVTIRVRPSTTGTSVRYLHNTIEPPSLVIHDGTTTVVFSPALMIEGLSAAAEFAQRLVQVASEWETGCRQALAASQSNDPFNVDELVAEFGQSSQSGGGEQA